MLDMDNLHAEVIRQIGGRAYLAGVLCLQVETVKSWQKRGIPARYWHRVIELAALKLPNLTFDDLDRTKPTAVRNETVV
jgi:hypothetical protein